MSSSLDNNYRFPGDVEIESCILILSNGVPVDISSIATEINIYQDLQEHYLRCEITIHDAIGLFHTVVSAGGVNGGFTGGEVFGISYKNKSPEFKFKRHLFAIHGMTDRKRLNENSEVYLLSGISLEAYEAGSNRISRSYGGAGGNTIDKMIQSVFNEFINSKTIQTIYQEYKQGVGFTLRKQNVFDSTNGLQRLVVPNLNVDETIDFMVAEADNDSHIPSFFFYENTDGFNFKDLNNLVSKEPIETYTYAPYNYYVNGKDANSEFTDPTQIITFEISRQTDILTNLRGGLFKSKMINIDILKKTKNEIEYNYERDFSKFTKLQKLRIAGSAIGNDPIVTMMTSRTGHDVCCPIFAPENHLPKRINEFGTKKVAYNRHIFNTIIEVMIYGNSELKVGDVIYLKIPVATTMDDLYSEEDKYLSGKYLITKVRHQMKGKTGGGFFTILKCVKDTGIGS